MPSADDFIEQQFSGLDEFYPGSKKKRRDKPEPKQNTSLYGDEAWDAHPLKLVIAGGIGERECFTIGALAQALNRRPVTIRSWEMKGLMPKARIRDARKRRLYTRRQIEQLVKIANEEGILDFDVRPDVIPVTFTERVTALLKEPL